jgi:hypothetical protein
MTAEDSQPGRISRLRLSIDERERVAEVTGELIAIQVYRQLQIRNDMARVAGCAIIGNCSNGSCNIIGNCSSSSKEQLQEQL